MNSSIISRRSLREVDKKKSNKSNVESGHESAFHFFIQVMIKRLWAESEKSFLKLQLNRESSRRFAISV